MENRWFLTWVLSTLLAPGPLPVEVFSLHWYLLELYGASADAERDRVGEINRAATEAARQAR